MYAFVTQFGDHFYQSAIYLHNKNHQGRGHGTAITFVKIKIYNISPQKNFTANPPPPPQKKKKKKKKYVAEILIRLLQYYHNVNRIVKIGKQSSISKLYYGDHHRKAQ